MPANARSRTPSPPWQVAKAAHYAIPEPLLGPRHRHPHDFQVFKILQGDGEIHIGNHQYRANAGGIFWIPPGVWHWSIDPSAHCPHMLEMRFCGGHKTRLPVDPVKFPYHIALDPHLRAQELLRRIVEEFSSKRLYWEWRVSTLIDSMILEVARVLATPPKDTRQTNFGYRTDPEGIARAVRFIHEHYHQPITLDELAHVATMSVSRFGKLFRALEHKSPIDYVIDVRMERALELMQEGRLSLSQIADAVGFGGIHHFSRSFKNRMGASPSIWQNGR